MKNIKLGVRIGAGFGGLLLIALLLGGMAVVIMNSVRGNTMMLAEEYVPEVVIASELECDALMSMYHMRGYALAERQEYLEAGQEYLLHVQEALTEAHELADRTEHLVKLNSQIGSIDSLFLIYNTLADQLVELNSSMNEYRLSLDEAAGVFTESSNTFLSEQEHAFEEEVRNRSSVSRILERNRKISLLNDIIYLGNTTRRLAWRAQAVRDPEVITEAFPVFEEMTGKFSELRGITRSEHHRNLITQNQNAISNYHQAMQSLYDVWHERDAVEEQRSMLGDSMMVYAQNLASAGITQTQRIADNAATALSASSIVMIIGLLIAAVVGVILAVVLTRNILKPILFITEASKKLAVGDAELNGMNKKELETIKARSDELGDVGRSFGDLMYYLERKIMVSNEIAKGNLGVEIIVRSDHDELSKATAVMRDEIQELIKETNSLIEATKNGQLDTRGNVEKYEGAWEEMLKGVNDLIEAFVKPIQVTSSYVNRISKGDIPEKITDDYHGDFKTIQDNLNTCIDVMNGLLDETRQLVQDSKDGKLNNRGDADRFSGGWAELILGVNGILDAVILPVKEAQGVLAHMAEGDLTHRVTGDYKGDHAAIKNALNQTLESLNEILGQVQVAVEQVNSGASQVSSASQSLSQGATEQASSLEEVSSSMTEVGSQTKQNADNASQANQLAGTARKAAEDGNRQMENMLTAMQDISDKSAQVQKIIKVIDEIAFQTNLLALNAAVEAARAGVHGKGFAVVAEEVRNLAQRSAKAANETTELIESNVTSVNEGGEIADGTAKALVEIVEGITKATDLVNEIASASKEQASAVDEITEAIGQIDQVTQANTANAEESAAAAEELSGQASQLQQMISRFNLSVASGNGAKTQGKKKDRRKHEGRFALAASIDDDENDEDIEEEWEGIKGGKVTSPKEIISLDDTDFDTF